MEDIKENKSSPSPAALAPPPQKISRIQHPILGGLCLITLVLLLAFAFIAWQWQQDANESNSQVAKQLGQLQQSQTMARSNASAIAKLSQSQLALSNQLSALSQKLSYNAQQLAQLSGGNRNDWLLSEAEYLLRLANQRLSLEQDIQGAELILSAADGVLKEIDDPALLPARIAVAEELLSLQGLANTDIQGAQATLRALMKNIPSIPERNQSNALRNNSLNDESANIEIINAENWLDQVIHELKKAVVIQRLDEAVTPLLPPEQKYYLQHNLRLMYEQSSLALVERNDESFQGSLAQAEQWLNEYFATEHPLVKAQLETITQLKAYRLSIVLPDISQSLRLVKARIEAMYRNHQLPQHTSASEKTEAAQ